MPSACWPPRRGLVGGISAIPAISATHTRGCMPGAWFAPGAARAISAISATRFDRRPSARKDSSTTARDNAARLRRDGAASAWLACDSRARALRPKTTDMVPNLSASVGRHTPQHCSVLSSAKRGLAADHGLGRPGLFVHRYRGSVVPAHGVTATHALPLSASPVIRRAIAYGYSRRLDRGPQGRVERPSLNDKPLIVERRSLRSALRASVETTETAICDSPAVIRGRWPAGPEGEGLCRSAARFQIGSLSKIARVAFPLPALPRMTGEEKIWSRS
jgi:hypothetical protein